MNSLSESFGDYLGKTVKTADPFEFEGENGCFIFSLGFENFQHVEVIVKKKFS